MNTESVLEKKVKRIESLLDISKIIDREANSAKDIRKYFRVNHLAYKMFHSDMGFMHFRVTKGDKISSEDILYQPNVISSYIGKGATVVELGPGQGSNSFYLAKKHPDASFIGVDLNPPKLKKSDPKNVKFYKHDYSDLSFIESNSVDVVFGIETIVYCSDKTKVFREVARILKENGILIVHDYALVHPLESYAPYEQTAMKLISKCGASALIESAEAWSSYLKEAGLTEVKTTDLHKETLPDLKQLEHKADHIMKKDLRVKLTFALLPYHFVNNILIGWLGYDACKEGLGYYNEWIYTKAKKEV
ncbi:MAG: class I SAM-dependent methyltransferase [Clostridia bacterium]|nr:class I SAM-dependent methyltransferase [Clostridia bacterium]